MNTLPAASETRAAPAFAQTRQPSDTYKLDVARQRLKGVTDGRDAVAQAVYFLLHTERYVYPIYPRSYGVELAHLVHMPRDYAMSELKRCVTEALTQDDRITDVVDWSFEAGKDKVTASFTVETIFGKLEPMTKEVGL